MFWTMKILHCDISTTYYHYHNTKKKSYSQYYHMEKRTLLKKKILPTLHFLKNSIYICFLAWACIHVSHLFTLTETDGGAFVGWCSRLQRIFCSKLFDCSVTASFTLFLHVCCDTRPMRAVISICIL